MKKLLRFLTPYRRHVLLGPLFKLTEAVFELMIPLVMADIIDVGIKNGDTAYILRKGALMAGLGLAGLGCALVCQYCAAKASQGCGTRMREELYQCINHFSHKEIDRFGTASLITRMSGDINQLQLAVAMLIRLVVRAPFLVIGATVMALLLDVRLSLIFLVAAPLVGLVLYIIMSRSVPFYRAIQKKLDRISLITRENLDGTRVIRAFSRQQTEEARFQQATGDLARTSEQVGKIAALLNPMTYCILNLSVVCILWLGGLRVYSGALTQGEIIAFVNYMTQISLALVVVANLVVIFTRASACADRVVEVLDTVPAIRREQDGVVPLSPTPGCSKIELRGVSFSYLDDGDDAYEKSALRDVTIHIMPGETIGIIGGTGCGKSTLIHLIPRFYDASAGEVLIDGVDVRRWDLDALRRQTGMVPQGSLLFSGTIRSNLLWGDAQADDEALWRVLTIAQADDFVRALPHGLDALVVQGGKNLSGGQRQRLTIARALVGNPSILILDDSASALDFATDRRLRSALKKETAGMTVLMISQRAGTVRGADRILVLDEGRVAGMGTHQSLFESCGVYREICLSQMSEEEAKKTQ